VTREYDTSPEVALQDWLNTAEYEKSEETVKNYRVLANHLREFCEQKGIETLGELDGRALLEFKVWRSQDVARSTLSNYLACLRVFVRYCQQVEIVPDGLVDRVPEVRGSKEARDEKLGQEEAQAVLDHLSKFEYASRRHATFALVWNTALRTGAVHSLDVEDFHPDEQYVTLRHRPDRDTPLKNGEQSEREVNLSADVTEVLEDYLEHQRLEKTDEHGREPLITTSAGRASKSAIARSLASVTRPCFYAGECPVDRTKEECEAGTSVNKSAKCPESRTGHPIRRGSITHHLNAEVPKAVVSDRCDVSTDVLTRHYDRQTQEEKRNLRKEYLDGL
jgi:site-specific recombinase XerD